MERKICILLAFMFLLVSCASTQNQIRFTENTFFSDNPELKVQILKNVLKQTENRKQGQGYKTTTHAFKIGSSEIVGITFWKFRHNSSTEWRSSDEQIITNMGMVPLGRVEISDKTWTKFVDYKSEKYIAFGYFKRMGDNLVAVYCNTWNAKYKNEIENFKKTRVLTEQHKQLINKAFDYTKKLFVIG